MRVHINTHRDRDRYACIKKNVIYSDIPIYGLRPHHFEAPVHGVSFKLSNVEMCQCLERITSAVVLAITSAISLGMRGGFNG